MAWADVVLVTDDDLTALEPDMPAIARSMVGDSGISAYDGKRSVAKRRIEDWIRGRGYDPDGLTRPSQLTDAAVNLELSLIYQAMVGRGESINVDKSAFYYNQFTGLMRDITVEYVAPATTNTVPEARLPIRFLRA